MRWKILVSIFVLITNGVFAQKNFNINGEINQVDSNGAKIGIWLSEQPESNGDMYVRIDVYSENATKNPHPIRTQSFKNGILYFDAFCVDGIVKSSIQYHKGILYRHYQYASEPRVDTLSKNKYYLVNGLIHYYDKRGRLELSAFYRKGKFKYVLFFRSKRLLKQFLKRDRDNPNTIISSPE